MAQRQLNMNSAVDVNDFIDEHSCVNPRVAAIRKFFERTGCLIPESYTEYNLLIMYGQRYNPEKKRYEAIPFNVNDCNYQMPAEELHRNVIRVCKCESTKDAFSPQTPYVEFVADQNKAFLKCTHSLLNAYDDEGEFTDLENYEAYEALYCLAQHYFLHDKLVSKQTSIVRSRVEPELMLKKETSIQTSFSKLVQSICSASIEKKASKMNFGNKKLPVPSKEIQSQLELLKAARERRSNSSQSSVSQTSIQKANNSSGQKAAIPKKQTSDVKKAPPKRKNKKDDDSDNEEED